MAQIAEQETIPDAIEATLNYIVDDGTKLFTETGGPGSTDVRTGGKPDPRQVVMHNGRPYASEFTLDRDGFRFVRHDTKVTDFYDEDQVRRVYYPEMEALVQSESGAKRVVVFDHTLRTADDALRETKKLREVVRRVHNDYTEWSGPQRVRDLLPDEAEQLLRGRVQIINLWRPLRGPLLDAPLAVCDASTVKPEQLVPSDLVYQNRVGETYSVTFDPAHRWYYVPKMKADEVLLLKCYDSETDGRARFAPHTAFTDPTTPPNAPPRESIELRALVFHTV